MREVMLTSLLSIESVFDIALLRSTIVLQKKLAQMRTIFCGSSL